MKILILGAGKMGSFFADLLSFDHDVAVIDRDPKRLRFTYNVRRFMKGEEIKAFDPDMVINAATVKHTLSAFEQTLPYLRKDCVLADIASVKRGLPEFYASAGHPYVSTHPMFGPTFASLSNLSDENAIIINEGDEDGRNFFRELYGKLKLHIEEYSFSEHDEMMSYSLSIPFVSSLVFGAEMRHQDAPGTTFKRHLGIARGLMGEDDYLLCEILMNPLTGKRIEGIQARLEELRGLVTAGDYEGMRGYLGRIRENLR